MMFKNISMYFPEDNVIVHNKSKRAARGLHDHVGGG